MVLAGVPGADEGPAVERPADCPLAEVRREAAKGRVGDPAPVVARLAPELSAELLDASDARVLEAALPALAGVLGAEPAWSQVKRWRFAVPEGRLDADEVNRPGVRIVVAGDTVTGASFGGDDHHRVFASGVDAARRLTSSLAVVAR
jgi:predicted NAD/FAD-dependent oxidoreductase